MTGDKKDGGFFATMRVANNTVHLKLLIRRYAIRSTHVTRDLRFSEEIPAARLGNCPCTRHAETMLSSAILRPEFDEFDFSTRSVAGFQRSFDYGFALGTIKQKGC